VFGLNPLRPPPLPPTVEVSATEFCCTALGPVFWVAWRIPWPPIELVIVTVPLALAAAAFCEVRLPVRLAVLNDDPAPPEAVVVAVVVLVLVVVCDRVPPPTTESFRAASILFTVFPLAFLVVVLPTSRLVASILLPLLALSHWPGPVPSALTALALPPLLAVTPGD
jgi:hypothetical protein